MPDDDSPGGEYSFCLIPHLNYGIIFGIDPSVELVLCVEEVVVFSLSFEQVSVRVITAVEEHIAEPDRQRITKPADIFLIGDRVGIFCRPGFWRRPGAEFWLIVIGDRRRSGVAFFAPQIGDCPVKRAGGGDQGLALVWAADDPRDDLAAAVSDKPIRRRAAGRQDCPLAIDENAKR
jgi:hypothetical protein